MKKEKDAEGLGSWRLGVRILCGSRFRSLFVSVERGGVVYNYVYIARSARRLYRQEEFYLKVARTRRERRKERKVVKGKKQDQLIGDDFLFHNKRRRKEK